MHSINHPHAFALVELGKLISSKICLFAGLNYGHRIQRQIIISDALAGTIWPIYPDIGSELGVRGNYFWRINDREIYGLHEYLEFAYQNYKDQKIEPGNLQAHIDDPRFDEILWSQL